MPADTYTSILGLILQGTGNNDNTWGDNLNSFAIQYIEDAIAGMSSFTVTVADVTLTAAQARSAIHNITGTMTADRAVIVPNATKMWRVRNATAGGYTLTYKTSSGTGVEIPNGGECTVFCDGNDVIYVGLSTARLLAGNGTVALPAYSFSSDPDSGLYRIGANNLGIGVNGAKVLDISTTGLAVTGDLSVSGALTATDLQLSDDLIVLDDAAISGDLSVVGNLEIVGALTGAAATLSGLLTLNATSHMLPPRGTTAQRSGTTQGSFRFNTTTTYPEYYNGTAWVEMPPAPLPRGYIDGCILSNNGTDATNDIDIAAGVCRDYLNAVNITCPAMTKQLDANWVAGTNQGFRNSAAGIANGTYHVYAVATDAQVSSGTCDYYAHTSADEATVLTALQAESGGSSYEHIRRIGSIVRSGGTILAFTQDGDEFYLTTAVLDVANTSDHSSGATATLTVPTGIKVKALLRANIQTSGNNHGLVITPTTETSASPDPTTVPGYTLTANTGRGGTELAVMTNTSGQVKYRANAATVDTHIFTRGWVDRRGKQ